MISYSLIKGINHVDSFSLTWKTASLYQYHKIYFTWIDETNAI